MNNETVILNLAVTSGTADVSVTQHTLSITDDDIPNIVINEILADSNAIDANMDGNTDGQEDEFVELVNVDAVAYDLTGYTIEDAVQLRHTFGSVTIPAGGSVVVFGGGLPQNISGITTIASSGSLGLNNGCLLYTSPSPRDKRQSRMPSSA